jgi:sugar/nucleoside kinase (ribokinase family)
MSGRREGFITGGTWCVDRNKMVEYWPGEDALVEILEVEQAGGGSGCNFAVDLRTLDPAMPVSTIAIVGDDDDGRFLLGIADAHGIERSRVTVIPGVATQYTDAFGSRKSGRRTHFFYQGTAAVLTPEHFARLGEIPGRIFHLGLPGVHRVMDAPWGEDANAWVTVLRQARALGLETSLELVSAAPERIGQLGRPCLPYLDYLVVNDVEIGGLAGEATSHDGQTDVAAVERAVRKVAELGPMRLVAAHFPMGAVAMTGDGRLLRMPSLRVPREEMAAANGAGDAFAAGTLYGMHQGWTAEDALVLGRATAGASLRGMSCSGTVVPWRECLALAQRWGVREPL